MSSEEEFYTAYCPKCQKSVKAKLIEQLKEGKVRVECKECGYQWEAFL